MAAEIPLKIVAGKTSRYAPTDVVSADGIYPRSGTVLGLGDPATTSKVDIGGSATAIVNIASGYAGAAQSINIGVDATGGTITLGNAGTLVQIDGALTVVSTSTFEGNTIIGNALTDTLDVQASVINNLTFQKGFDHSILVDAASAGAGNALSVVGGAGFGANAGGGANVTGGAAPGAGAGGQVTITGGTSATGLAGGITLSTTRTATGAGASNGPVLTLTQAAGTANVWVGTTAPNGTVTGAKGSLYLKTDDGTLWINVDNATTWQQFTTSAGSTLQAAYNAGNTIATTTLPVALSVAAGTQSVLTVTSAAGSTNPALLVNGQATGAGGDAFVVQDGGVPVLTIDRFGKVMVVANNNGTSGSAVEISSGAAPTTGAGGPVQIEAGAGGTAGDGGTISLTAGATAGTAPNLGGAVNITAGDNSATLGGAGGSVTIAAGGKTNAAGTAAAGSIALNGGADAGSGGGGAVSLLAGNSAAGVGGSIGITSGNGDTGGGTITITGGNGTGALSPGAIINLYGGVAGAGGLDGNVVVYTGRTADGTPATDGPALEIGQVAGAAHIWVGQTSPNGTVSGATGDLYHDTLLGELWLNTGGTTVWSKVATGTGAGTLQSSYNNGNTIATTTLSVALSDTAATAVPVQTIARTFAGGDGLYVQTGGAVTGSAISIQHGGASAAGFLLNNIGGGPAFLVQDNGNDVILVNTSGGVTVTARDNGTVGSAVDITAGAGVTGVGGAASLKSGASIAAANAGTLTLAGGDNTFAGAGLGGAVSITGGAKTVAGATAAAGGITITGGANTGTVIGASGGTVTIAGGAVASTSAPAGNAVVRGGAANGAAQGASAQLIGGANTTGGGGQGLVRGGDATGAGGTGGSVLLWGGSSTLDLPGSTTIRTDRSAENVATGTTGPTLSLEQTGTNGAAVDMFAGTAIPSGGTGVVASEGSLYLYGVGAAGRLYIKTGALATDWSKVETGTGGSATLQTAYVNGNSIAVTTAEGTIDFSNTADATDVLTVSRTFAGAGVGVALSMGASTTGAGIAVTQAGTTATSYGINLLHAGAMAAPLLRVNPTGSGAGNGIAVLMQGTTSGNALSVAMGATSTGNGVNVAQVAGATGIGVTVAMGSTASAGGITVTQSVGGAATGLTVTMNASSTGRAASFTSTNNATNSTVVVAANGTGSTVALEATGANAHTAFSAISNGTGGGDTVIIDTQGTPNYILSARRLTVEVFGINQAGGVIVAPTSGQPFTVDTLGAGAISLDSVAASNFTVSGATADLTLGARGTTITLNSAAPDNALVGFTATSIIGALNELKVGVTSATQVVIPGLTTTGLGDGDFGYISAAMTLTKTDADAAASSVSIGANEGTVGSMTVQGVIENAKFTTAGGSPANGSSVWLATGTEEAGAAGKLTATAPSASGDTIAEMGIVLDNTNYAALKTCKVLLQPKTTVYIP
jgi:hypothetical protein